MPESGQKMADFFKKRSFDVLNIILKADIDCIYRKDNLVDWNKALYRLPYIPVAYSNASIDFHLAYQFGQGGQWLDISLILKHDKQLCGVWPLSFSLKDKVFCISSHGLPILPPLLVKNLSEKSRKTVIKKCLELLKVLCTLNNIPQWKSAESFAGQAEKGLSQWHIQAMTKAAKADLRHEIFVDLSLEKELIKASFRKSYKSLISAGQRIWDVGVLANEDPEIWSEFHELYVYVAGRETRSTASWNVHYQAITKGDAFLVYLRNKNNDMVGGGFFNITRDEGVYGVGAYDRTLFDKPLGHVVQYRAIEEMKFRGLCWYKVGAMVYSSESSTQKELSIAHFKKGFATHFFPQYLLKTEIK